MIKAKPIKCMPCNVSSKNNIPIAMAEGGIKRVTKDTFVAPARSSMLKNNKYPPAVDRTASPRIAKMVAWLGSADAQGVSIISAKGIKINDEAVTCPKAVCRRLIFAAAKRRPNTLANAYESVAPSTANCAPRLRDIPARLSGPTITITPTSPNRTPKSFCFENRSSARNRAATRTVHQGVVAFKMAARPAPMVCCPKTISPKGITLFSRPRARKACQVFRPRGS